MDDVGAEVCKLATLHELVHGVDVAHVLQEAEGEEERDVVLGHEPGDDGRVERPDLVAVSLGSATEVLQKQQRKIDRPRHWWANESVPGKQTR